ncbi:MAG: EamA family transporter [Cyanobacteria bacterium J06623_7]
MLVLTLADRLDPVGIIAAIAGAATIGLGMVLLKLCQPPVSLIVFTAWQPTVGGLVLLPVALFTEGTFSEVTRTNLWGFIYLSLIGTGLAYGLWFRGIARLSTTGAAYLGLLSPVMASTIGYFRLQETFTPIQLLGGGVVLTAVVMGQQS